MSTEEFTSFGMIAFGFGAFLLFCPLVCVYLTLKYLDWSSTENLLSDSWRVWFALLISFFLVAILTNGFSNLPAAIFVLSVINVSTAGITLSWLEKSKKSIDVFSTENEKFQLLDNRKVWKTAVAVAFSTIFTVLVLLLLMAGIGSLIEQFFPRTEPSFGLYDI